MGLQTIPGAVDFDNTVSHVETYSPEDDLDIKPHGGGGTDFAPVFAKIIEENFSHYFGVPIAEIDARAALASLLY